MSTRDSPTVAFLRNREAVLGGRLVVHVDPEIAAELLAAAMGGRQLAYEWALALLAAFDGGRAA
jgi:hypothetical protein